MYCCCERDMLRSILIPIEPSDFNGSSYKLKYILQYHRILQDHFGKVDSISKGTILAQVLHKVQRTSILTLSHYCRIP